MIQYSAQKVNQRATLKDQESTDASALMFRQHRNRAESVPVPRAVRNGHRREGDVQKKPAVVRPYPQPNNTPLLDYMS